jgi:hypothetical protein
MANPEITSQEQETEQGSRAAFAVNVGMLALSGRTVTRCYTDRIGTLDEMVAKMNKISAKLSLGEVRYTVLGEEPSKKGPVLTVALFGEAPRLEGYNFLCRIEHTRAGNLVSVCSAAQSLSLDTTPLRTVEPKCDHCGTSRARRDTFILERDGELRQIGRNCLADFIRSTNVAEALRLWSLMADFSVSVSDDDDGEGPHGGSRFDWTVSEFLSASVASVRVNGFHKSGTDRATRNHVAFILSTPPRDARMYEEWKAAQPTEDDAVRAVAIRAWLMSNTETSDYMHNMRVAATLPCVGRSGGLLASAPVSYMKAVEKVLFSKKREEEPRGAHVGEVGKRAELGSLTVMRIRYSESDFGTKTILALRDAQGNDITWFASGARDYSPGDVLPEARATVKKHEEYKGRPQTVILRLVHGDVLKASAVAS